MTSHRTRSARRRARILLSGTLGLLPLAGLAEPPLAPPPPPLEAAAATRTPLQLKRAPLPPRRALSATPEPDALEAGSTIANPFGRNATAAVTTGQTLTAPVTLNAKTTTDALTATQTGAGRAINAVVNNGASAMSAIRGATNGKGSGVNGVNSGTAGPAGKFEITNAASSQPSLLVTTKGTGGGVSAVVTSTSASSGPAVYGENLGTPNRGTGLWGEGSFNGVYGNTYGNGVGVLGHSNYGPGMEGQSATGNGVHGYSDESFGVRGDSDRGTGVYGQSFSGTGVSGFSASLVADSFGVKGYSAHYAGVAGMSDVAIGTYGYSKSNFGIVGRSDTNYAGVFYGPVSVSGVLVATNVIYTSDRDQKQGFAPVDSADVLSRVAAMPITAWGYKDHPAERHMGPMAQDFRAAFGLGADERHIDVVDGIGVSLAAIQELQRQLQQRDAQLASQSARIEALETQAQAQRDATDARIAALKQAAAAMARATTAHP